MTATFAGQPRAWREAPIELKRLARAMRLRVHTSYPIDAYGSYWVTGPADVSAEPHWVQMIANDAPLCDCGDHIFRETLCAHGLAVLLYEKDERAWAAVNEMLHTSYVAHRLPEAVCPAA